MVSKSNLTEKELISYVNSIGYKFERLNKGNHRVYKQENKKILIIPVDKKKLVKLGLLYSILKNINVSKIEFINYIN
ncbi:hypothetical protein CRV01_03060 [Arcobacter sp. CECT 8983]|uniref:type II toxin-antitoxin system HicA family toxin n=1 Tax=Arcobacter sp. CECT 8983 TaxID=2044508 RepID=UPI00100B4DCB|nr:type II toxin-antitoxin system HicA family toxin [Arcobacter sp. CECT 8983]RXJ90155.1 hypothetical protein CRV01_03060 [Arcobacter sp. CECT 8983]